jgi:N-formylglutamate deformylase
MLPTSPDRPAYSILDGDGPLVAVALHSGHAVRRDVAPTLALSPRERLREEDPFTDRWTQIGDVRIVSDRSRFEVDLNRPREKAVYMTPEDAWGLRVWKRPPEQEIVRGSLEIYDAFYAELARLFRRLERQHGWFMVLDLHSYNHRRLGPEAPPDDPGGNPEVNIGTGSMDRSRWAREREDLMSALRSFDFEGRPLDVRENVRFKGGHLAEWVHDRFPMTGCVFAIEVKKFFMDEWTGELYPEVFHRVGDALRTGAAALRATRQTP